MTPDSHDRRDKPSPEVESARCRAVCEALDAVLENPAMQDKPITLDGPSDNLVRSACRAVVEAERAKWAEK